MNENQTNTIPLEVLTPSALETMERTSIDVQIATAHKFPRSLELFKKRATDMVQQDFETAESCIYKRPVGKGDDGKQKIAEGKSIRMAEIVAACYGNIRVSARVVEQTERYVKCVGMAHDLESNYAAMSEAMESTVTKFGQPFGERMRIVVAKAALSKAKRDAIFTVCPAALCKPIESAAKAVILGATKTVEQRRELAKKWIAGLKIKDLETRVFDALGVVGWNDIGDDELFTLTGIRTSMKDDGVTIAEAFPVKITKPNFEPKAPGLFSTPENDPNPPKEPKPKGEPKPEWSPLNTNNQAALQALVLNAGYTFDDFISMGEALGMFGKDTGWSDFSLVPESVCVLALKNQTSTVDAIKRNKALNNQ